MQKGRSRGSSPFTKRRRWRAQEAQEVLAALDASGLELVAFAQQVGVDPARLKRWRRVLVSSPQTAFEEVTTSASPTAPAVVEFAGRCFEVVLASGRVVRVPESFDSGALDRLLSVVDGGAAC
jgi:transposase-like protein